MARIYNLKPDPEDHRDRLYMSVFTSEAELPVRVDLRAGCSEVVDQGELGSCTANAIASGLREYWEKQDGTDIRLSRLWLYWKERNLEGTINEDSGAYIRDGMKVLQQMGCAREEDWPYDISKFKKTPSVKSSRNALNYSINAYHRVATLKDLKIALADGCPVVLGIKVYESFEGGQVEATGIVPLPKRGENYLGGHAVLAAGYIDDSKRKDNGVVICRNSWGINWGDMGYFYLHYSYFRSNVTDMWTGR